MDSELAGARFDTFRLGPELNVKTQLATSGYDSVDKIGVKSWQGSRTAVRDCHLRSSARRHMSKFKPDIAASYKQDLSRQLVKLQELFACRKVFRSRYL